MTVIEDRQGRGRARIASGRFYVTMAAVCTTVAFLGFAPTYWGPMLAGRLEKPPVYHIHAVVFFAWSLFITLQVWLASSGSIARHRLVGLAGISLATAMTIFGLIAAIRQIEIATSLGLKDAGQAFAIVPIGGIVFFAVTFALAVRYVRRPELHKRLMLLAAISILDAAVARWFLTFLAPAGPPGPPPVEVTVVPALTAYLLIAAAIAYDWRTRGRPHAVYVIGGAILVAMKVLQVPVSKTDAWHSVAGWLAGLLGVSPFVDH